MIRLQNDHLETLLAVVEHRTFDAAADVLRITPSAVSQRIKTMEQLVGRVLVQRTTPIRPTADGEVVLRHARQVQLLDDETSRALGGVQQPGSDVLPSIPLAVNSDSLLTWFLDALELVLSDTDVVFDLHREDQERTATLLRAGTVMAAVTATSDPVQGCSSERLGTMRYLAVASPRYVERRLADVVPGGSLAARVAALDRAPLVDYDRADDLQQGFLRDLIGHPPEGPRHFIPTSSEYDEAVRRGFGWGLLPESESRADVDAGRLVSLVPERHADVELWWQRWNLASPLLDRVTDAVRTVARERLRQR